MSQSEVILGSLQSNSEVNRTLSAAAPTVFLAAEVAALERGFHAVIEVLEFILEVEAVFSADEWAAAVFGLTFAVAAGI
jgi:hypothetical protein